MLSTKDTAHFSTLDPEDLSELILEATAPTTILEGAIAPPPSDASIALAPFAPEPIETPPPREPTELVSRVIRGRKLIARERGTAPPPPAAPGPFSAPARPSIYRATAALERPRRALPTRTLVALGVVALAFGATLGVVC